MDVAGVLWSFVPVAVLIIVVPGPDVLLVVRNAVSGHAVGLATAVGTLSGLVVHASAAALGLSALMAASATAFTVVKVVGALYLVGLGLMTLWAARARRDQEEEAAPGRPRELSTARAARQGFLTDVLNPKVAVFFVAFLPQFVPTGAPVAGTTALLGAVFVALTGLYLALLVLVVTRAAAVLSRPSVRRWMDRVAGAVFVAFGARLAATTR